MNDKIKETLVPERTKLRVKFNNSVVYREKSRINRVVIVTLATACCVLLITLYACVVFSVQVNSLPEWQQDNFMLEAIPGLRYRPKQPDNFAASTLISFDRDNYTTWTRIIDDFIKPYKNPDMVPGGGKRTVYCDYNSSSRDDICYVDPKEWRICNSESRYGYHWASPCIFLKLNKIYNWVPGYYNDTASLPENMPRALKEHIKGIGSHYPPALNTVWVSCEGENPADVENRGPIQYIPQRGFPGYFFPFTNKEGYLSPLVAVWFRRPTTGVLINIECRLWAPNIEYNREKGRGFVHFELMID